MKPVSRKTAELLKSAGWPQGTTEMAYSSCTCHAIVNAREWRQMDRDGFTTNHAPELDAPDTDELMEALPEHGVALNKYGQKEYEANHFTNFMRKGNSPVEALAKLWLKVKYDFPN
jgi:hypothetical protein